MDIPAAPRPSCQLRPHSVPGTMASSEEDGSAEEKDNNNKKRTKSALAIAWLTFYNIAMTAGYVDYSALSLINKYRLRPLLETSPCSTALYGSVCCCL